MDARLFVGRQRELRVGYRLLVQTLDRNPRNLLLTGPRGIGKSWLAQVIAKIAKGERSFVHLVDDDEKPFNSPFLAGYVEGLKGGSLQQLVDSLLASLRRQVGPSQGIAIDAEFTLGFVRFKPKERAPINDLIAATILELKDIWAAAARTRGAILLVIDELDEAAANEELGSFLKVLIGEFGRQGMDYIAIVVVGLTGVMERLEDQHGSVPRLFHPMELGTLSESDALDLIDTGLLGTEIGIDDDARALLVEEARGLPSRLQLIAYEAFNDVDTARRDTILREDVAAVALRV